MNRPEDRNGKAGSALPSSPFSCLPPFCALVFWEGIDNIVHQVRHSDSIKKLKQGFLDHLTLPALVEPALH